MDISAERNYDKQRKGGWEQGHWPHILVLVFVFFPPFFHVINVVGQLTERAAEGSMGIDIYLLELVVLMFHFLLSFFIPSPNSRRESIDTDDPVAV